MLWQGMSIMLELSYRIDDSQSVRKRGRNRRYNHEGGIR
jgi:hypothetical protein